MPQFILQVPAFFGESIPDFSPFFIYWIFLHFSDTGFFSIFHREKSGVKDHIFLHFYGEKSCLKATFFSTFQVQFRGFPGGSTPSISDNHSF